MSNLAQLMQAAARANPDAPFGTFQQHAGLAQVMDRARRLADDLRAAGLQRGDVAAVIGHNCAAYLVTFMAAQLVGAKTALINPAYPDQFLAQMLDDLAPAAIVWIARAPGELAARALLQLDATDAWDGRVATLRTRSDGAVAPAGCGADCAGADIAAYVHTSGTTGNPKFCALSHGYLLRLGRYFADTLCLSRHDVLVNPLPLFHINPIGNSVIGALTAGAAFLSAEKFSVSNFWPLVKQHRATVLVLHGPPAAMLKARTTGDDARGHAVRIGFFCDPAFLAQFDIPVGIGGYGSTEAGGYSHSWTFRAGDTDLPPEGATHLSGQPRPDLECRLQDDEILVRGKHPQVLFSGYARAGQLDPHLDADGWFHTGDRGRFDRDGNLIFIERASESIRVNAEYVPIDFVEERLKRVASLGQFALWRVDAATRGHEAVLYTTSQQVDLDALRAAMADLPRYMQPTRLIRIEAIPRDVGVGKVQRRLLGAQAVLHATTL